MQFHQLSTVDMSTVLEDRDLNTQAIQPIIIEQVPEEVNQQQTQPTSQLVLTEDIPPDNQQTNHLQTALIERIPLDSHRQNQQQESSSFYQHQVGPTVPTEQLPMDYDVSGSLITEENQIRILTLENPNPSSLCSGFLGVYASTNLNGGEYNNTSGSDVEYAEPSACTGCGAKILDRYFLVTGEKQWHVTCLRCSECNVSLDSELTCFSKDGQVYCKEDYYRRFAVRSCTRCQMPISSQELVMRARDMVYHVGCFACASCNAVLNTGEQFGMRDNLIFCKQHYEFPSSGEFPPQSMMGELKDMGNSLSPQYGFPGVNPPNKGRPRKRKNQPTCGDMNGYSTGLLGDGADFGPDGYPLSNPRQKRIRTSFKHHQLRILKSYFALNQNPDAKDLKQLSQKTGLTKRVLQVWFQNARAKYRRNLMKQDSNGNVKDGQGVNSPGNLSDNTQTSFTEFNDEGSRSPEPMTDMGSPKSILDLQDQVGILDSERSGRMGHSMALGQSNSFNELLAMN